MSLLLLFVTVCITLSNIPHSLGSKLIFTAQKRARFFFVQLFVFLCSDGKVEWRGFKAKKLKLLQNIYLYRSPYTESVCLPVTHLLSDQYAMEKIRKKFSHVIHHFDKNKRIIQHTVPYIFLSSLHSFPNLKVLLNVSIMARYIEGI